MREDERIRNEIGSISIMSDGCATDDNIGIALATYFERLPECPENDTNDEVGWSQWAIDKTNDVLNRIVEKLSNKAKRMKTPKIKLKVVRSFSIGFTVFSPTLNGLCFEISLSCLTLSVWSRGTNLFGYQSYWNA